MNRYAQMAQKHWQQAAPDRVAALEDPTEFFSTLGEQVETRIQQLQDHLAGPDPAGEEYLAKVGRLNMARLQAEEVALAELVWLTDPATGSTVEDPEDLDELGDPDEPSEMDRFLWRIHSDNGTAEDETANDPGR
ncbi:hypothetical protein CLV30_101121 [Haloactinopolyspora alba]|uniref:TnpV protein n=1 Tax=Haloactinopolyspora alba TaxID=648780 RepID=A0A2P8EFE0_9ACTN|nr:hypothetical protein [Haloactinopolyspora alba]PSL08154.1 hypothetical protein CLV30_101121 [Haloactinopolyspora alba]